MTENNYNWETEFNHETGFISHIFSKRVKAFRKMNSDIVCVYKDGNLIKTSQGMSIDEYENFLAGVAKDAATMKQFEVQEP